MTERASSCSYCLADDPEYIDFDGDTICADCSDPDYTREDARDDHAISLWEIQNDLRDNT